MLVRPKVVWDTRKLRPDLVSLVDDWTEQIIDID